MRKGILSDTDVINNCPEYQPIPMKAVSQVLKVPKSENDYTGIKQIYRKVPPRPMNINALATSLSQMGKNRAVPLSVAYPSVAEAIKADIRPLANFKRETDDLQGISAYESALLMGGIGEELEPPVGIPSGFVRVEPFEVLTREPVEPVEDIEPTPFVGRIEELESSGRGGAREGAGRPTREDIEKGIRYDIPVKEFRQIKREQEERVRKMGLRGEVIQPIMERRLEKEEL